MGPSIRLFDALADDYERHFQVPHRRAYDQLAWEMVQPLVPRPPALIIDAGCGTGRWARRLLDRGHRVIGIEQAPRMAARARESLRRAQFELYERSMEECDFPDRADLVLALGSVQYTDEPGQMIQRLATWTRPGGWLLVLVDSLVALVLELVAAGKRDEALDRMRTRRGVWREGDHSASLQLFDSESLQRLFREAGLEQIRVHGLLVGSTALGRSRLTQELTSATDAQLALERELAAAPMLADCGKQLLAIGRRPLA